MEAETRRGGRRFPLLTRGDVAGFATVFANNIATMLAGAEVLEEPLGAVVLERIIPAVGISLAFGSLWYVFLALAKAAKTGRKDLTAIPFGINTPGVFAFNAGIILHVYNREGRTPEAAELAWEVGVAANFVQGLVEILLAPVGPLVARFVPMVALLGSLASIGIAFLFTNVFLTQAAWPVVTLAPLFLLLTAMFAKISVKGVPGIFPPIILGIALAWVTGRAQLEGVEKAAGSIGWYPCQFGLSPFAKFGQVANYLGITVPVALTVSVGTIQVRQMAENAGDNYDLRLTMLGDGLSTIIASLFGSPWGMTVYIGHNTFKEMGSQVGYSILCAAAFIVVTFSGVAHVVLAVVPIQILNPTIMFVGLAVGTEALEVTPSRHWPAFLISLVPGFCNWATLQATSFAMAVCHANGSTCPIDATSTAAWDLSPELRGLHALGQGYILSSIYFAAILIYVIDRTFLPAAVWAAVAALSASCGLIHSETVFLPWAKAGHHWRFVAGYTMTSLAFLVLCLMQRASLLPAAADGAPCLIEPASPAGDASVSDDSSSE